MCGSGDGGGGGIGCGEALGSGAVTNVDEECCDYEDCCAGDDKDHS